MYSNFRTDEKPGRVYSQYTQRRGVTLFIVLALMTMFALLVTAFMVITTQARRQAEHMAKALIEPKENDGGYAVLSSNFDTALEKLLVGDNFDNPNYPSVIGPHSILENLYGHPDFGTNRNLYGNITANTIETNGYIGITTSTSPLTTPILTFDNTDIYTEQDLTGNIITIIEVPAGSNQQLKGKSTFIIGTTLNGFQIAPFSGITLSANNLAGCTFIINSPAFGGTGPGFDSSAAVNTAALSINDGDSTPYPFALRPNILAPGGTLTYQDYLTNNLVLMNPDYTAPDYLNMFLAWNDVRYVDPNWVINNIIPSFHRPQLIRYWFPDWVGSTPPSGATPPPDMNELRKVVLRPLPTDHPNFTGSNPAAKYEFPLTALKNFNLIKFLTQGPWDVDNDGDGIADGIWIDAGLGTVTINGTTYKKLVSYYVLDMDGRLNVNVHGNKEHLSTRLPTTFDAIPDPMESANTGGLTLNGSGSGPAEVRLDLVVGDNPFEQLLEGKDNDNHGRYGKFGIDKVPEATGVSEADASVKMYDNSGIESKAYGHPTENTAVGGIIPDWRGVFPMTFDPLGNRYFDTNAITTGNIYAQNPYLINPYEDKSSIDSPFTSNDLQYLLRSFGDTDYTTLPQRLRNILDETNQYELSKYRLILGTRSSDIPVVNKFGGTTATDGTFSGLYDYIRNYIYAGAGAVLDAKAKNLFNILPKEIQRGEKINLNRLTLRNDWTTGGTDLLKAKAKLAQEIFYLLCVLCYEQIEKNNYLEGLPDKEAVYTRLAQWSVNFVDFIDPDATMTPLIFSINPFDDVEFVYERHQEILGHLVDNSASFKLTDAKLSQPLHLIWGMEKPEVAITETFAVHNRRVADSIADAESPTETCTEPGCTIHPKRILPDPTSNPSHADKHDKSYDQVMIPQGSLFVELYRQGNPHQISYPPNDIVEQDGSLNLTKKINGDYIWRLAISSETSYSSGDLKDKFTWGKNVMPIDDALYQLEKGSDSKTYSVQTDQWKIPTNRGPDRYIWFGSDEPICRDPAFSSNPSMFTKNVLDRSYYNNSENDMQLTPNSYLVIGPRNVTSFASQAVSGGSTAFGVEITGNTARIDLENLSLPTDADPNAVQIMYAEMDLPDDWSPADKGEDKIGVNISERCRSGYYSNTPYYTKPSGGNGHYKGAEECKLTINSNVEPLYLQSYGTVPCVRTIYLQRLADPNRNHHPTTNPYITVDWNMIDLQIVNSEKDEESQVTEEDLAPHTTPSYYVEDKADMRFISRQWGNLGQPVPTSFTNLWNRNLDSSSDPAKAGLPTWSKASANINAADLVPETTFGYLNSYGNSPPTFITSATLAILESKEVDTNYYRGLPAKPFLHFPWYNAPLANSYELMLVPATPPGRFGVEFYDKESGDFFDSATKSLGIDATNKPRFSNPTHGIGPYLNFFHSSTTVTDSLNLSRLFDYVRVPSKFAGTIRGWTTDSNNNPQPIYEMREPGKINLNTATAPAWEALQGSTARTNWNDYDNTNGDGLYNFRNRSSNTDYPSEFIPFRSPQAVALVPPLKTSELENKLVQNPADTTLLRKDSTDPALSLLEPEPDTDNPYTLLENYMRLSDMTTTRSNVFAVWMTIGYFEVQERTWGDTKTPAIPAHINSSNFSAVYPDGYMLGVEKGLDDGTVKRHRAFYLIDRSTPVGFRRGNVIYQENGNPHYKRVIIDSKILE